MATMPRLRISGPLAPYDSGLWSHLLAQGYSPSTSKQLLYLASRLSRWLADAGLQLKALTRENIEEFFSERRQAGYTARLTARSLRPILQYLELEGKVALPKTVVPRCAIERLLNEYERFLDEERGLQARGRSNHRYYAKKFLSHRFDSNNLG